jgi:hypothetical protein
MVRCHRYRQASGFISEKQFHCRQLRPVTGPKSTNAPALKSSHKIAGTAISTAFVTGGLAVAAVAEGIVLAGALLENP